MMLKKLMPLTLVFLFFILSTTPIFALNGTDVWQENGSIVYLVDAKMSWNRQYFQSTSEFPDYDVTEAEVNKTYTGIVAGKMVFESSTENIALESFYAYLNPDGDTRTNPDTGLNADGDWTGAFHDTVDFTDGHIVDDIKFTHDYTDDNGEHSITKHFKVAGEPVEVTVKVEGSSEKIKVWDLTVDDFTLDYTYQSVTFVIEVKNIVYRLSKTNGVLLASITNVYLKMKNTDGSHITLMEVSESITAFEVNHVTVKSVTGVSGLEWGIALVIIPLIIYRKKTRARLLT